MKFMPSCNIDRPFELEGKPVVYLAQNGLAQDHAHAAAHGLVVGNVYTVKAVQVNEWDSQIYLNEVAPSSRGPIGFNSVMFLEQDVYTEVCKTSV